MLQLENIKANAKIMLRNAEDSPFLEEDQRTILALCEALEKAIFQRNVYLGYTERIKPDKEIDEILAKIGEV